MTAIMSKENSHYPHEVPKNQLQIELTIHVLKQL